MPSMPNELANFSFTKILRNREFFFGSTPKSLTYEQKMNIFEYKSGKNTWVIWRVKHTQQGLRSYKFRNLVVVAMVIFRESVCLIYRGIFIVRHPKVKGSMLRFCCRIKQGMYEMAFFSSNYLG